MPTTTSKNLGQVAAIITSSVAPTNVNVIWLDTSGETAVKKIWDPNSAAWVDLRQESTASGDGWGNQVIVHADDLDGDGTDANPLKIAQQGATTGQVIKWDGDKWAPANDETGTGLEEVTVKTDELVGDGTPAAPISIKPGTVVNQALIWDGSKWTAGTLAAPTVFRKKMVIMFSGTPDEVPPGWALCDGNDGKTINGVVIPNLSKRFVVGYDANDVEYNKIGKTGGAANVQLTVNNLPAHGHGVNDPGHTHQFGYGTDQGGTKFGSNWMKNDNIKEFRATSKQQTGITIQQTGGNIAHENRPPFYVLAFIIYVG